MGEQCESFWALAKPLSRIARYMGPYNHVDFLDDAFARIAAKKLGQFPDMMAQHTRAVLKKQGAKLPACCTQSCICACAMLQIVLLLFVSLLSLVPYTISSVAA